MGHVTYQRVICHTRANTHTHTHHGACDISTRHMSHVTYRYHMVVRGQHKPADVKGLDRDARAISWHVRAVGAPRYCHVNVMSMSCHCNVNAM